MVYDKFKNIADIYDKYRPEYPKEYIEYLKKSCNLNSESKVADIGAGTGIFTKQLLDNDLFVLAVEPNEDMRNVLKEKLKDYKKFIEIDGTAENTNISNKSIDIVTASQAFHWFDIDGFRKECKRILKPNGKVCLLWNMLDMNSDITKEQEQIHYKYTKRTFKYKEVDKIVIKDKRDEMIEEFFKYGSYELKVVENNLINTESQFIGVNLSKSYSLRKDDQNFDKYVEEFRNIFKKYSKDGILVIPNNTYCYLGNI